MEIFRDHQVLQSIPDELLPYSKKIKEGYQIRVVGVIVTSDQIYIFLPKNTNQYNIGSSEINKIIRLLSEESSILNNNNSINDLYVSKSKTFQVIEWLIDDFRNNGIYIHDEIIIKDQKEGIIDWNKTINHVTPLILKDDLYILDTYRRKNVNTENQLSYIHGTVIEEIARKYSFLFSTSSFKYNGKHFRLNKNEQIIFLKKILKVENNNRTRLLIQYLISYITNQKHQNDISILTEDFDFIWERMVKYVWNHDNKLLQYVPKAKWDIEINNVNIKAENNQIPDTIVRDKYNNIHILDAKYYDLSNIGEKKVPIEWYSVVKQFFYDLSFDYYSAGSAKGDNIFILPAYNINYSEYLYKNVGKVKMRLPDVRSKDEIFINVYTVPVFSLIDAYLNKLILNFK